ncbi:MAG: DNA replication/repair protein RecF [Spirochaetales bacterium]|nr:DNA replication/repair protein RecF [Candidatus Physcosoma equi]
MRFTSLQSQDFRNIFSGSVHADSENIVLTGPNGQGKTNILEEIYILCYGGSFRTAALKECVNYGKEGFFITGSFREENGEEGKITVSFFNGNRKIILDGKEVKDRKELIYQFPCIVFCHEDIDYIKGEPEYRRKFFDQMMSLYSPLFFDNMRSYRKILAQRNAAIKNNALDVIPLYNERLAYYGQEIMRERADAVYEFNNIFPDLFKEISGSNFDLKVVYQPSWKEQGSVEEIVEYLENNTERDIRLMTTSSGIHRDRFNIESQYGPFSQIGSTGQLRLCSLIFRIAEARYFTLKTGKKPIILLDDVLLELDPEKRGRLLKNLHSYSQAWYTFLLDENYNERKDDSIHFFVEEGALHE